MIFSVAPEEPDQPSNPTDDAVANDIWVEHMDGGSGLFTLDTTGKFSQEEQTMYFRTYTHGKKCE